MTYKATSNSVILESSNPTPPPSSLIAEICTPASWDGVNASLSNVGNVRQHSSVSYNGATIVDCSNLLRLRYFNNYGLSHVFGEMGIWKIQADRQAVLASAIFLYLLS